MNPIRIKADDPEWHRLLNACFEVPLGQAFLEDFPLWNDSGDHTLRIGLRHEQKLVGACGVRIAPLKVAGQVIEIGLIGGVITHPDLRGSGIAHEIIKLAHAALEQRELRTSILWGRASRLYADFGYRPFGSQLRGPLADFVIRQGDAFQSDPSISIKRSGKLTQACFNLALIRARGLELCQDDFEWWSAHRHVDVFTANRENGECVGYAVVGKGIDLENHLHDWAAVSPEVTAQLFKAILGEVPQAQIMIGSCEIASICPQFGALDSAWVQESVAQVRGLDRKLESDFWIWGFDAV